MNHDEMVALITDLKQFISTEISHQLANVATKDDIARLDTKIDETKQEILEAIGDTMTTRNEEVDEQLVRLDHRMTRLEQSRAAA